MSLEACCEHVPSRSNRALLSIRGKEGAGAQHAMFWYRTCSFMKRSGKPCTGSRLRMQCGATVLAVPCDVAQQE